MGFRPPTEAADRHRLRLRVDGVVQGVGFRPYVYGLAVSLALGGFVGNDAQGVFVEVEGDEPALDRFVARLRAEAPPLAVIEGVQIASVEVRGEASFRIERSTANGARDVLISPDVATCADCLRELRDPADRRYGYPFINCTNCGPRYTIVRDVPYDRPATTMAGFPMCAECAAEYHDPANRRFHAQPICCPACGPRLQLDGTGPGAARDVIEEAAALLRAGKILSVKGLGGYHLAVDATHPTAAATLRARKHREDKPFAVLVADIGAARELAELDATEEALLKDPAAPVVLLRRRPELRVAAAVAPDNRALGLMLPYTPLHHLLAAAVRGPIVLTSGNLSDEPIAFRDADARDRLASVADAFLTHDRPIHTRVDDSVVRVTAGGPVPVRRSRGFAPRPVALAWAFPRHILACGAELKNTFCVAKERHAFVSHHVGDLENYETYRSYTEGIEHLSRLFAVSPAVVAHDLHPEYLSTKHARELEGVEVVGVQHHHAHIASCLADNGERGPVIGLAFDGLGYGTDGTIWGGEVLVADLGEFERVAHFETVPMPGGVAAIREPWRMAAAYLDALFAGAVSPGLGVVQRNSARWDAVVAVARAGVNSPQTSSAGRLFDAVAAICGVRDRVHYEGQAAVELEQLADPAELGAYTARVGDGQPLRVHSVDLVGAVVDDLRAGVAPPVVAARFHNGVAGVARDVCALVRERTGLESVALSGGVFQNTLLVERLVPALSRAGFDVLTHARVPPNDGGISLGQAAVAGELDRRR